MEKKARFVIFILLSMILAASCAKENIITDESELIQKYISAYTSGEISRESPIRIQFNNAVADSGLINKVLEKSPVKFVPEIEGYAMWTGPGMLEYRTQDKLPAGTEYTATFDLSGIIKSFDQGEKFRFNFTTILQSFEVELDGLTGAGAADLREQQLSGRIITADVENGFNVEKVLKAVRD